MPPTMTPWWHFWKTFLESGKLSSSQQKEEFGYSFYPFISSISDIFLYTDAFLILSILLVKQH
jgi:hypothetical protein